MVDGERHWGRVFRILEEGEELEREVCNSNSDDRKGYTEGQVMAAAHVWPRLDTLPTKHGCHDTGRRASTTHNRQVKSVATSPAPPPPTHTPHHVVPDAAAAATTAATTTTTTTTTARW